MPIPPAFYVGAGTGAVGLYTVENKFKAHDKGSGHHKKPHDLATTGADMSSADSVMFGNSSASTHGADCSCCKKN